MIPNSSNNAGLNLGGLEGDGKYKLKFYMRAKNRINSNTKPHQTFRNWTKDFRIPWICFIEVSMMILYFIIGILHQRTESDFTIDFTKTIDTYFLDDYDFEDPPEMSNSWHGLIYFKDKLTEVAQSTGNRFFTFANSIPLSYPLFGDDHFNITIITIGGEELTVKFTQQNVSLVTPLINAFVDSFAQILMIMKYHMQVAIGDQDERTEMTVTGEFTLDTDSDQVILDFFHTRSPRRSGLQWDTVMSNLDVTVCLAIIILGILAIILTLMNTYDVYIYSGEKAERNFQRQMSVFWAKYDKWSFFSLISNSMSVIANSIYLVYGNVFNEQIPASIACMAVASFLHCLLIVRYLRQKPSLMIIVNVIFSAGVTLLEFLVGCMVIFAGYLVLGCCLFGTFNVNYATFTQGAVVLIAVIHGDSIQDMFDAITIRTDIPWWVGFLYMSVWVFFSLTIMFNISISIFEESLTREIYTGTREDENEPGGIEALAMNLPRSYRTVY